MTKRLLLSCCCLALMSGLAVLARTNQAVPEYKPVANWPQLPKGLAFGQVTGIATDAADNVYVFHRDKQPIIVFDPHGKFLRSWGDGLVNTAHGLRIDHEGNVWTTDIGNHLVIKYDPQGKVFMTLGTKNKKGATQTTFNKPADIAVTKEGDIYVADGYGNSRVVKFSKDGKYVKEWGRKGAKEGEFNLPHAILL